MYMRVMVVMALLGFVSCAPVGGGDTMLSSRPPPLWKHVTEDQSDDQIRAAISNCQEEGTVWGNKDHDAGSKRYRLCMEREGYVLRDVHDE
jgi:hypothetical protein